LFDLDCSRFAELSGIPAQPPKGVIMFLALRLSAIS
jgi:hypothetical protein